MRVVWCARELPLHKLGRAVWFGRSLEYVGLKLQDDFERGKMVVGRCLDTLRITAESVESLSPFLCLR